MAKLRIKTGNGGAGQNGKQKLNFAAAAKASREREDTVAHEDDDMPLDHGELAEADTGGEPLAPEEGRDLLQEETTVHVRAAGSDPFADNANVRRKKRRSAASTMNVQAVPPPVTNKNTAGKTGTRDKAGSKKEKAGQKVGVKPVTASDVESMATMTRTRMRAGDLPKPGTSPTVVFLGVVGWLYAIAMVAALFWISGENEAALEKARKPLLAEKKKWKGKADTEVAKVDSERQAIAADLAKLEAEHARITGEAKVIEGAIAKFEAKRNSIQSQMAQIQENFMPTGEQAMNTGMDLNAIQKKYKETMALRGKILRYYNKRYNALNKEFWACHKNPQAAPMSTFFAANKHTPFAAAAAFFAAEKYYKTGWLPRAKSLYVTIQKDYGMTPYASLVPERLQQIEAKAKYKSGGFTKVHPFKRYETEPITEREKEQRKIRDEERARRKAEEEAKKAAQKK